MGNLRTRHAISQFDPCKRDRPLPRNCGPARADQPWGPRTPPLPEDKEHPMTLFEAIRATFRRLHYSPRTEEAYLHWIREFICFHDNRHPRGLGPAEITAFLNHIVDRGPLGVVSPLDR